MGSWDETCAISNIPITREDDVVLVFLVRDAEGDAFVPCLPIYGSYSDCGRIKITVGQDPELSLLSKQWSSYFQKDLDLPAAQEALAIERIPIRNGNFLHRVLVRRDVWDAMLQLSVRNWDNHTIVYEDFIQNASDLGVAIQELPAPDDILYRMTLDLVKAQSYGYLDYGFLQVFERACVLMPQPLECLGSFLAHIVDADEGYTDFLEPYVLQHLLASLAELRFVEFIMSQARMSWTVPSSRYVGSQVANFSLVGDFHEAMSDIAKESMQ